MKTMTALAPTALLCLVAAVTLPSVAADDRLQCEWLQIQNVEGRKARASWWRELDKAKLDTYIGAGADVSCSDRRGWTPLHSAARFSADPEILETLLEAGADVGARNSAGDTPLHWAAAENANADIVRALLQAGADVNARDNYGWLPIHTAADRNPNPEIIEALLQAGSEVEKRAYFMLFRPRFLLKHNSNLSDADKQVVLDRLTEAAAALHR